MSTVYDCANDASRASGLAAAAAAVRSNKLVVLPTDTVYGIGCDAFSRGGVAALLRAKKRGPEMPIGVLVGSWSTIDGLVGAVDSRTRTLIEAFWPGDLSLVLPHAPSLAWDLGSTRGTVMLRMPLHPVALELLRDVGPMAVSSANTSGNPPAASAAEAREQFGNSVGVYLDGGAGGGSGGGGSGGGDSAGLPSSIIDLTGANPRVLREGAVAVETLAEALGTPLQRPGEQAAPAAAPPAEPPAGEPPTGDSPAGEPPTGDSPAGDEAQAGKEPQ